MDKPLSRIIGFSELWRADGTGDRWFFVLWCPVWKSTFRHSTAYWEGRRDQ